MPVTMSASTGQAAVWSSALTRVLLPRLNSPTTATVTERCSHHRPDPGEPLAPGRGGRGAPARAPLASIAATRSRTEAGPEPVGAAECRSGSRARRLGSSARCRARVGSGPPRLRSLLLDLAARRGRRPPTRGSGGSWRRRPPPPRWGACSCCTGSSPSRRPSSPWGSHRAPHQCQASERRPDGAAGTKRGSVATEDQCGACGERNPAGSAFCVFCGTYLGWDEPGHGPARRPRAHGRTGRPEARGTGPSPPRRSPRRPAAVPPRRPPPRSDVGPAAPTGTPCPQCGQDNPATRRFCSRCGYPLVAATAAAADPGPHRPPQHGAGGTRRPGPRAVSTAGACRALYRWRRVLVTLAVIVGVGRGAHADRQQPGRLGAGTLARPDRRPGAARRRHRRGPAEGLGGADVRRRERFPDPARRPGRRRGPRTPPPPDECGQSPGGRRDRAPLGRADPGARAGRLGGARRATTPARAAVPAQAARRDATTTSACRSTSRTRRTGSGSTSTPRPR